MSAERIAAAKRLQELGWAFIRYGQRIERCCAAPSESHESAARLWRARALERMAKFRIERDAFRRAAVRTRA